MRSSRRMIHWGLRLLQAAAGILAGIVFFHLVVMPLLVRRGRESVVPDLTGLTVTEARARIKAAISPATKGCTSLACRNTRQGILSNFAY